MAKSEKFNEILDLGEKIVSEFDSEERMDTLSRWMSHYIAEQIELAKSTTGRAKVAAQERCADAILSLWKHRAFLPFDNRPFQNFEKIFEIIQKLNPEDSQTYYFERSGSIKNQTQTSARNKELETWLRVVKAIDQSARVCLEYALVEAFNIASDKKTKDWIKLALGVEHSDEISLSRALFPTNILTDEILSKEQKEVKLKEALKKRIDTLQEQISILCIAREHFVKELEKYDSKKPKK